MQCANQTESNVHNAWAHRQVAVLRGLRFNQSVPAFWIRWSGPHSLTSLSTNARNRKQRQNRNTRVRQTGTSTSLAVCLQSATNVGTNDIQRDAETVVVSPAFNHSAANRNCSLRLSIDTNARFRAGPQLAYHVFTIPALTR